MSAIDLLYTEVEAVDAAVGEVEEVEEVEGVEEGVEEDVEEDVEEEGDGTDTADTKVPVLEAEFMAAMFCLSCSPTYRMVSKIESFNRVNATTSCMAWDMEICLPFVPVKRK